MDANDAKEEAQRLANITDNNERRREMKRIFPAPGGWMIRAYYDNIIAARRKAALKKNEYRRKRFVT